MSLPALHAKLGESDMPLMKSSIPQARLSTPGIVLANQIDVARVLKGLER